MEAGDRVIITHRNRKGMVGNIVRSLENNSGLYYIVRLGEGFNTIYSDQPFVSVLYTKRNLMPHPTKIEDLL